MKTGDKNRLYLLADSETLDNVYYEENGTVKKQPFSAFDMTTNSPFIRRNPIGWKDEELMYLVILKCDMESDVYRLEAKHLL